ncbi:DsbC family protein [Microbulbifer thermotolerans]|uniref:Thiol:disulfide interchange protein n=1 Tax=Microbulbifer thermotolerans TaxID=252514 RepID=A0A143HL41_MICTH|nr:DsbC family protein [Microbulbifer thermotolerans]AMX02237.1 protein-disulfide isomerase [Microbulbifer thermotolerans]MCX2778785.1 DsbC family protein [Microbulbifer thermotolerans]MCX2781943.1 DsbC family protein [Microbulbifer thermotolerans]MCX2793671.1 DsbC family protein [Microbulbifer thermotolerans]MCX2800855.1 DsbC family protein [Microbulbifer thermotolerans]
MTLFKKPLVLAGALAALLGSMAQAEVDASIAKTIKARLEAGNPKASYGEVRESPISGLYEVDVDGGASTLFVSKDGSHFIFGDLYQVKSGGGLANLSEERRTSRRAKVMEAQDIDDMIVFSPKGEKKAHIYVFTDVDCGYCRKLHNDVPELNRRGIEVRYLAFPRAGLKSPSYRKIATAWCAEDRNSTLTALKNRQKVPLNVCANNPVAKQYKLGNEVIDVRGTPTIVLEDGSVVPGYVPPDRMASALGI